MKKSININDEKAEKYEKEIQELTDISSDLDDVDDISSKEISLFNHNNKNEEITQTEVKPQLDLETSNIKELQLTTFDSDTNYINQTLDSLFIITIEGENISISFNKDFVPKKEEEIPNFIKTLEFLFNELTSNHIKKGFVNDVRISVKGLEHFLNILNKYKLIIQKAKEHEKLKNKGKGYNKVDFKNKVDFNNSVKKAKKLNPSLLTNKLYYNLVMLGLYLAINQIDRSKEILLEEDLKADLKVLNKKVLILLNPLIKERLRSKSVMVSVNGFIGFDTEYEEENYRDLKNRLLSVQLASTSGLTIVIPKTELKPLTSYLFKHNSPSGWGDDLDLTIITKGLDALINYYRNCYMCHNIRALNKIHSSLDKYKKFENNLICIYLTEKSEFLTKIRHYYYSFSKNVPSITNTDLIPSKAQDVPNYSMESLIRDSESMVKGSHIKNLTYFINMLDSLLEKTQKSKESSDFLLESSESSESSESTEIVVFNSNSRVEKALKGPYSRISYRLGKEVLNVSIWLNSYIILHESSADLSMLSDFDKFKDYFNIINRSFVTMGKPLELFSFDDSLIELPDKKLKYSSNSRLFFRDTGLIAPAGIKSLADIGSIYGPDYKKLDIGSYRDGNMSNLRSEDPELFDKYAIQDSVITLKHGIAMEEFNSSLGRVGVPLTMSGLGKAYVADTWDKINYKGYQLDSDILIGDLGTSLTPKKSRDVDFSKYIVMYLACYRGGRNESFMYGLDTSNTWFDYDLTSCYTTVMALLGSPDYDNVEIIDVNSIDSREAKWFIFSYISMEVDFSFPVETKYPCIPTRVDKDVDIYPLKGSSTITGVEYLIAKAMGCKIIIKNCIYVPFKVNHEASKKKPTLKDYLNSYEFPFRIIVNNLQKLRRTYPKKTFYNYMYKEIGNSIYGQIAMGLSGKNKFDVSTKSYKQIKGSVLTNPLLASYITGFTRSLIAECLHNINILGGDVVSVTTDGFICNIEDLEIRILKNPDTVKTLLCLYRSLRMILTAPAHVKDEYTNKTITIGKVDPSALEVKSSESGGLLSWKTRGQLGSCGSIIATTGFQNRSISRSYLFEKFKEIITNKEGSKDIQFIMRRLLGAVDVYKKDCNVMIVYSDRKYELCYDNKRSIVDRDVIKDNKSIFYDSKPWPTINEYGYIRYMKSLVNKPEYKKGFLVKGSNSYQERLETSIRSFIVACVSDNRRFGVPLKAFNNYREIKDFIHKYEPAKNINITPSMISNLKHRNTIPRSVPRNKENENFIKYVKANIVTFEVENFFTELSSESIKLLKDAKKLEKLEKLKVINTDSKEDTN